MKRLLLVFGLAVLIIPVYAQEFGPAEPEQTDIFVPELILQVEESGIGTSMIRCVIDSDKVTRWRDARVEDITTHEGNL